MSIGEHVAVCRILLERERRGEKMIWCVWVIRMRNRSNNNEEYKTRLKKIGEVVWKNEKKEMVFFLALF